MTAISNVVIVTVFGKNKVIGRVVVANGRVNVCWKERETNVVNPDVSPTSEGG